MVSIISNSAALSAQQNLNAASQQTQASIYRLSSGNAIYQASDNVAGLAIGSALQSQVVALQAAVSNTIQAGSMLGVADGALSNISDMLQQQIALATQANSGSLNSQNLSFLNEEFQNLVTQINQLATTTNFNGVNLLDGSLYGPAPVSTATSQLSTSASGLLALTNAAGQANGKTIEINGVTFTFLTTPDGPLEIPALSGSITTDATNLYNAIQNVLNNPQSMYANDKALLSGMSYSTTGGDLTITSLASGSAWNSAGASVINIIGALGAAGDLTVNGTNAGAATVALSAGGVSGVNNDLAAGTFPAGAATAYNGTATTITQGTVADNLLTAISTTAAASGPGYATGVATYGVSNNPAFVGTIQGFEAQYENPGYVNISITVGSVTYSASNVQTAPTAAQVVRLASSTAVGGYFDIQIDTTTNTGQIAVKDQSDANNFATRLNTAFSGLTFYQNREISSYTAAGTVYPTGSNTASGNLAASQFNLINSNFEGLAVSNVTVTSPVTGATNAVIEITINDEVYTSGYNAVGQVTALGTTVAAAAQIGLVSTTNPNNMLIFTNGSLQLTLSTPDEATGLQNALTAAFNINTGASSVVFQTGSTANINIQVQIQSSQTTNLYVDDSGNYQELSVATSAGAQAAIAILNNAVNTITSIRANVGALESRFNYATAGLQVAIQNQDAARSTFLDTDIGSESSNFAQEQVRVQASIAMLAQANQLPQSLLKLMQG